MIHRWILWWVVKMYPIDQCTLIIPFLQIENFSLQIHHEPFYISVTGFFNMDFTLLKAVSLSTDINNQKTPKT